MKNIVAAAGLAAAVEGCGGKAVIDSSEQIQDAGVDAPNGQCSTPGAEMTRAEIAKLLVQTAGLTIDTSGGPDFSDVPPTSQDYPYIETAYHNNIIQGYSDGTFQPDHSANRAEFAKLTALTFNLVPNETVGLPYTDVSKDQWFYSYVDTLYNWSVLPKSDRFCPAENITDPDGNQWVKNAMNPHQVGQ